MTNSITKRRANSQAATTRLVRKGFTLIELMVVMLILAILAALIIPKLVSRTDDAKIAAATTDESTLSEELHTFRLDCGRYPTTEEGLNALRVMPSGLDGKWKGPYQEKDIAPDPWGNPYQYQSPGTSGGADSFSITSYGSDGQPGGSGNAADIVDNEG